MDGQQLSLKCACCPFPFSVVVFAAKPQRCYKDYEKLVLHGADHGADLSDVDVGGGSTIHVAESAKYLADWVPGRPGPASGFTTQVHQVRCVYLAVMQVVTPQGLESGMFGCGAFPGSQSNPAPRLRHAASVRL
jgi:hypothetical protein